MIENINAASDAVTLSPIKLFLEADIIVKLVMLGLAAASIWTWTIIVSFALKIGRTRAKCDAYEAEFWKAGDIDAFYTASGKENVPSARVLASGVAEWRRSTNGKNVDREGTRQRLATAMEC